MAVLVVPVPVSDKSLLWDELQEYIAELMEFGTHKPVDGVFEYPWFDLYWTEHNRFPFWAYVDGERVAFALVIRPAGLGFATSIPSKVTPASLRSQRRSMTRWPSDRVSQLMG